MSNYNQNMNQYDSVPDPVTLQSILQLLVNHAIQGTPQNAQPPRPYQIVPDLSQTIGDYNGEDETEALAWLDNLNAAAGLHNWPEELKLQMARRHLVGAAYDWWLTRMHTIVEWAKFETAFNKTFVAEISFTQRYSKMQARRQAKG